MTECSLDIKSYVITINPDYKTSKQYLALIESGITPEIVPGVIASDEDMKPYRFLEPRHVGVSLAHFNCWEKIINENIDYALIFEDDAFPISKDPCKMNKLIKTAVKKAGGFDILKLNSEGFGGGGSFAAYIIKKNLCKKKINLYFGGAPDVSLHFHCDILNECSHKLSKKDLFITDETGKLKGDKSLFGLLMDCTVNIDNTKPCDQIFNYPIYKFSKHIYVMNRDLHFLLVNFIFSIIFILLGFSKKIIINTSILIFISFYFKIF